jgi:hypothetical protein
MSDDDVVLRSARNAFLVVLVTLLAISVYQFAVRDGVTWPVAVMWVAGAGVFYASKYYYGWRDDGSEDAGADPAPE